MNISLTKTALIALAALLITFSPVSERQITAVEIAPIEKLDPEDLQNDLDNLGSSNELNRNTKSLQTNKAKKAKPSIWCWLTNQSRKPANFHYIDIIEILD